MRTPSEYEDPVARAGAGPHEGGVTRSTEHQKRMQSTAPSAVHVEVGFASVSKNLQGLSPTGVPPDGPGASPCRAEALGFLPLVSGCAAWKTAALPQVGRRSGAVNGVDLARATKSFITPSGRL